MQSRMHSAVGGVSTVPGSPLERGDGLGIFLRGEVGHVHLLELIFPTIKIVLKYFFTSLFVDLQWP